MPRQSVSTMRRKLIIDQCFVHHHVYHLHCHNALRRPQVKVSFKFCEVIVFRSLFPLMKGTLNGACQVMRRELYKC